MEAFIRPAGPVDAEAIAEVQRISWRATYEDMLSAASLARVETAWDSRHWRFSLERADDRSVALVVDGPEHGVIGFCVGGARRSGRDPRLLAYKGEIYLLYLLPEFQGLGHGGRLMTAMARVLVARGLDSALVWALSANRGAIAFYQRLSGSILTECRKPFFGESVSEIALGWSDLTVMTGMHRNLPG